MSNVGATLLPILGGFFFLYFCHYTKFYVRRLQGYSLFFLSAVSYFNTGIEHLFDEEVSSVTNDR